MAITLNSKTYNFIGFDRNGVSIYKESSAGVTYVASSCVQCQLVRRQLALDAGTGHSP